MPALWRPLVLKVMGYSSSRRGITTGPLDPTATAAARALWVKEVMGAG